MRNVKFNHWSVNKQKKLNFQVFVESKTSSSVNVGTDHIHEKTLGQLKSKQCIQKGVPVTSKV